MTKKLWGGRFQKKTDPLLERFARSISYDQKLAAFDVLGSAIHVQILKEAKLLKPVEANRLDLSLQSIYMDIDSGKFNADFKCEDIHTNIQNLLEKKVGNLALKIHMARSRNDQVVFATKLYCKTEMFKVGIEIENLIKSFKYLISKDKDLVIPGFTHLQHAQPVYLKDYLSVYVAMLMRDYERLKYIHKHIVVTMGSGALAGTPIKANIYFKKVQKVLKKIGISESIKPASNSLDTVSDRDFVIETLNALAIIGIHLSRLSEDLIIWSTKEFDFVELDESFCTGSSLMPQKKNPDALELMRGYSARAIGNMVSVLTLMKGLPLTYNRDMQLDKEPLFSSFEIVSSELKIMAGIIKTLKFNKAKIEKHLEDEGLYATDLVYYLVGKGVAFKEAHTIIGKLIKHALDNSIEIKSMPGNELKRFSDKLIRKDIIKLLNPKVSVESKKSIKR